MNRRMGYFYTTMDMVESGKFFPVLEKMQFIPYRVEYMAHMDRFEYIGTSPLFDVLEQGMLAPEYNITVSEKGDDISVDASSV